MQKKEMVLEMVSIVAYTHICGVCEEGKCHRLLLPSQQARRAKEKLELIHTDICDLMSTESLHVSNYLVLSIDDYNMYYWVYFMKHRLDMFNLFV